MKKQNSNFKFNKYLKQNKWQIFCYIFLYSLSAIKALFTTVLFAQSIEQISNGKIKETLTTLIIIAIIEVVERFANLGNNLVYVKVSNNIAAQINADLVKQAFKIDSASYTRHNTGKLVNKLISDPTTAIQNYSFAFEILVDLISEIIIVVYLISLNLYIGLALVLLTIINYIIEINRVKQNKKNWKIVRNESDKVYSMTNEMVRSEKDAKSMNLEAKLTETISKKVSSYISATRKQETLDRILFNLKRLVSAVATIAILCLGVYLIDIALITLSTYIIIYTNRRSADHISWYFGNIANYVSRANLAISRMAALYNEKYYKTETFGDVNIENMKGSIEFKNVEFYYEDLPDEEEKEIDELKNKSKKNKKKNAKSTPAPAEILTQKNMVLKKLNLKIEPNTTVAFVGISGSGKSTILSLISKMHTATKGKVLVDGVNITDLNKDTVRKNFTLVNQFPYIFDLSIRDNLMLVKQDATEKDIENALKKSALFDFVKTLPKGIDTIVGESGVKLSGGQKQRLAIARALLKESKILMFDESTSSLDNLAQEEVKKSIDKLKGTSTIIIVAHRLSTIKNVDVIYYLENGKIVDSGSFEELLKSNETFKILFQSENLNIKN